MDGTVKFQGSPRLVSIDAYRGLVMFLMLAEVLKLCAVSAALPASGFWRFLCRHQSHVQWVGCSLHDLIQPSFSFLVGVVLPFSVGKRRARGQSLGAMSIHAAVRALILILLGLFLNSPHRGGFAWEFDDTLTQIGLGYFVLFLLAFRPAREAWVALGLILFGYWLAFALHPLPGPEFDYAKVGVSAEWLQEHGQTGFAAHWQKNSHLAWAFDVWFLNLFPRRAPFTGYANGLATLSFIPLVATMILGLIAGHVLRSERQPWGKVAWFGVAGVMGLFTGWLFGALGLCPVVKAIWTPSWVLFSGGWCFLLLAIFYAVVDIGGQRRIVFPWIVIGMNSIAAYIIAKLFPAYGFHSLNWIFGVEVFQFFGDAFEPLVYGAAILAGYWLVLFLMYRWKLFLRI